MINVEKIIGSPIKMCAIGSCWFYMGRLLIKVSR